MLDRGKHKGIWLQGGGKALGFLEHDGGTIMQGRGVACTV